MVFNGDLRTVILRVELVADRSQRCVEPNLYQTVEEFKLFLAHLTGIPSDLQILVSKGRFLENGNRLMKYELEPDQTIFLVQRSGQNTLPPRTHGLDGYSSASDTDPVQSLTIADLLSCHTPMRIFGADGFDNDEIWRDYIAKIENEDLYSGDNIPNDSVQDFLAKIENQDLYSGENISNNSVQQNQSDLTDSITVGMSGCNTISQDQSSSSDSSLDGNASEEVTLEHKFASQLADMERMGLKDRKKNIRALLESSEDVEKAVQCLLDNPKLDD